MRYNVRSIRNCLFIGLIGLPLLSVQAKESGWSGLIEVEGGSVVNGGSVSELDVLLAKLELGYAHQLTKNTHIDILLLHEDNDTEAVEVDHAIINVDNLMGLDFSLGRQFLPFGTFNSGLVSDPLTHEIGETREAAIGVSKSISLITAEAYVFQGDAQPVKNAWYPDFMTKVSLADEGDISYSFDAYFISEFANSELLPNSQQTCFMWRLNVLAL